MEGCLGVTGKVAVQLFVRTTQMPRSSSGSWPRLSQRTWVEVGVGDLFAGLRPQDVLARKAVRPERAKIVDAQHDAPGLAGHLRAHEKRHRARGHVQRQASGRAAIWRWASGTW